MSLVRGRNSQRTLTIGSRTRISTSAICDGVYALTSDRMITHDIQRFSTHLAAIYSNLAKPVLDVILYNYQLSQNVGAEGLVGLTIAVQSTAVLCESNNRSQAHLESHLAFSAISNAAFWCLYCSLCATSGITPTRAFTTSGVCGRDCFYGGRTHRAIIDRAGVCDRRQA